MARVFAVSALMAATAMAACTAPTNDLFEFYSTNCTTAQACQGTFCGCLGVSGGYNSATNCATQASGATCDSVKTCFMALNTCSQDIITTTESSCTAYSSAINAAVMAAVSGSDFATSDLGMACQYTACQVQNFTGVSSCNWGTNYGDVCSAISTSGSSASGSMSGAGSASGSAMGSASGSATTGTTTTTGTTSGTTSGGATTGSTSGTTTTSSTTTTTSGAAAVSSAVMAVVAALAMLA